MAQRWTEAQHRKFQATLRRKSEQGFSAATTTKKRGRPRKNAPPLPASSKMIELGSARKELRCTGCGGMTTADWGFCPWCGAQFQPQSLSR